WRVKPIEDRFIVENYYADIGLPLFSAALIFDDALYLLIALAGIAGLALYRATTDHRPPLRLRSGQATTDHEPSAENPARPPVGAAPRGGGIAGYFRWLLIAWLLYVLATVLLPHGGARYRHFLFPALIPYAAWTLTRRTKNRPEGTRQRTKTLELLSN